MKHQQLIYFKVDMANKHSIARFNFLQQYWGRHTDILCFLLESEFVGEIKDCFINNKNQFFHYKILPSLATEVEEKFQMLNDALSFSKEQGYEILSYLPEAAIPLYPVTWKDLIIKFKESGKLITYAPLYAKHPLLAEAGLHFNVNKWILAKGHFPLHCNQTNSRSPFANFSFQLTYFLQSVNYYWKKDAYYLHSIYNEPAVSRINMPGGYVHFKQFIPESSLIISDDPVFWDIYQSYFQLNDKETIEWKL